MFSNDDAVLETPAAVAGSTETDTEFRISLILDKASDKNTVTPDKSPLSGRQIISARYHEIVRTPATS